MRCNRPLSNAMVTAAFAGLLAAGCGEAVQHAPDPTCDDQLKNGNETAVDCGGSCGPCGYGEACRAPGDCATNVCTGGLCACEAGYAPDGDGACEDIDDCQPNPCDNGGLCTDRLNAFTCACVPGYSGPTCANDDDDCTPNPCKNGGTCTDAVNDYSCACADGFWGADCAQVCELGNCVAGTVTCGNGGADRACSDCVDGWGGADCETDLDECALDLDDCAPGATCANTVGGYTCTCPAGTSGDGFTCDGCPTGTWGEGCAEACADGHCAGGVTCDPADGTGRTCTGCDDGWMGPGCAIACDGEGCASGQVVCSQDGSERLCPLGCAPGRWGEDCNDPCPGYNCDQDAVGYIVCGQDTGYSLSCAACIPGWSGVACQTLCDQGHCLGTVSCDQQDPGSGRSCPDGCAPGYWGTACDGVCAVTNCAAGAICDQTTGAGTGCESCEDGWFGAACESACSTPDHCAGTTRCEQDGGTASRCESCETGWYGATCESACVVSRCADGPVCAQDTGAPVGCAACEDGWFGPTCDTPCAVDGCAADPVCAQDTGAATGCGTCAPGHWGDTCEASCGSDGCDGDVTCDRDTGGLVACAGCVAGRWGPICESTCGADHCLGAPTCDQGTGAPTSCAACAPGYWGPTCESACSTDGCAGVATCDQDTGAAVACTVCELGRWGETCAETCENPACAGVVACDRLSGTTTSCAACAAGHWGPTCASACDPGACLGTVTCGQVSGNPIACPGGCVEGRYGTTCQESCVDDRCASGLACAQATGATTSCDSCAPGYWGGTCASDCATGHCADGVSCDQANGVITACGACQDGFWGATCGASCAQGHCVGTVRCDQASGSATACEACAEGFWGGTCGNACAQGQCIGKVACDRVSGATTSCMACTSGWWGVTCGDACTADNCAGGAVCDQGTGTVTTCGDCAPGWIGDTCDSYALTSCLDWLDAGETDSGVFVIDPDGMGPLPPSEVWCDMTTDGGGYTFYKAVADQPLSAVEAEGYCAARGMRLFIPRTAAHLHSAWQVANSTVYGADATNEYLYILRIYPQYAGATCANTPLQRANPDCDWRAGDGGSFFVSDRSDIPNPSGDNAVDASMYYTFDTTGDVTWYDDSPAPGAATARFLCDIGDKDLRPVSCAGWRTRGFLDSGVYTIDPDGDGGNAAYEVYCDMDTTSGGWTLAMTSSDDGVQTWTWNKRALMTSDTTTVGSLDAVGRDFKSRAHHEVVVRDLLFVHRPSGVTAEYADVGDGTRSLAQLIAAAPSPNCDYGLAGHGYPLTGGTLTASGSLCDTDLYFNLGDHETSLSNCQSLTGGAANATYGPSWSAGFNNGCPFDDPSSTGLGPTPQCGGCGSTIDDQEQNGRGFGSSAGLNTGASGTGTNALQVFVR